jgi:predicted amidophosphoribosyltransferase
MNYLLLSFIICTVCMQNILYMCLKCLHSVLQTIDIYEMFMVMTYHGHLMYMLLLRKELFQLIFIHTINTLNKINLIN